MHLPRLNCSSRYPLPNLIPTTVRQKQYPSKRMQLSLHRLEKAYRSVAEKPWSTEVVDFAEQIIKREFRVLGRGLFNIADEIAISHAGGRPRPIYPLYFGDGDQTYELWKPPDPLYFRTACKAAGAIDSFYELCFKAACIAAGPIDRLLGYSTQNSFPDDDLSSLFIKPDETQHEL